MPLSPSVIPSHRIGIFGGSFDPPHQAHTAIAKAAIAQLQLNQLIVVPTGFAWYKERILTPSVHRLAMCELAFGSIASVVIDPRETQKMGASYTIDTVQALSADHPRGQFFLILGADQAFEFINWHNWQAIIGLVRLAIVERAPDDNEQVVPTTPMWQQRFSSNGITDFVRLRMPAMAISATQIRSRIAEGRPIGQLSPAVVSYIQHHQLYRGLS